MIHKEQSKEATISSTSTIQDNNNLDNIKYLNDRVLELTRKNDAQWISSEFNSFMFAVN